MPEIERQLSLQEKIEGFTIVEEKDDVSKLFESDEQNEPKAAEQKPTGGDTLDEDEIDRLMEAAGPEEDERLKEVTPERIAQEWEQLSETAHSVVMNASDEKFSEITEKYKNIPDTRRKAGIMIIMRRLINKNHPLASRIHARTEPRQKAA